MSAVAKRKRTTYTQQQRDAGMIALIRLGPRKAEAATGIDKSTLCMWRDRDCPDRYAELRERVGPLMEAEAVDQARQFVIKAQAKEAELLDAIDIDELPHRERPGALRNVAVAVGLAIDKTILPLTDRPNYQPRDNTLAAVVAGLKALDKRLIVEGTAEEEDDSPLVAERGQRNAHT